MEEGGGKEAMSGQQSEGKQALQTEVVRARAQQSLACELKGLPRVTASPGTVSIPSRNTQQELLT